MPSGLSKLALEFVVIDGGSAALRGISKQLGDLGEGGAEAGRKLEAMADSWQKGLKAMATAGSIKETLIDPGLAAAADLQEALANLKVNLDASSVEEMTRTLAQAQADAARVAGPTRFSQEDVIGVQTALKKAGLDMGAIVGRGGAAEAVAQLATGESGMGIEQAQQAIITMGSIFGLSGSQYAGGADLLSRAGSAAATDPASLSQALAQASSAGALGLKPDETLALLGVLGNMGVQGGAAGTTLNAFLRQAAGSDQKYGLGMFSGEGQFLGLQNAAEKLRQIMEGRTDQERQLALQKAFGDEGARAALALLRTGSGSLEGVLSSMGGARSLQEKVDVLSQTSKAQSGALAGTSKTALANLYAPLLAPMSELTGKANEVVGSIGTAAQEQEGLAKAVSYGSAGIAGIAALVGAGYMLKGGYEGLGALRALGGGLASDAVGIAKGKAVAAAAGVTPVYVTNWPASGMPGGLGAGAGPGAAGGAAGLSTLGKAGLVGAAGVAGFGIGTAINEGLIKGTKVQDMLELAMAGVVGYGGGLLSFTETGKNSRRYFNAEMAPMMDALVNKLLGAMDTTARVDIHVDQDGGISWESRDGKTGREAARGEAA